MNPKANRKKYQKIPMVSICVLNKTNKNFEEHINGYGFTRDIT